MYSNFLGSKDNSICESLIMFGMMSRYARDDKVPKLNEIRNEFAANGIDSEIFPVLTKSHLREIKKSQQHVQSAKIDQHCVFCLNNGEPQHVVTSHAVRDCHGKVQCRKLRIIICPLCGATGDVAHTMKYCPRKPIITMDDIRNNRNLNLIKKIYLQSLQCFGKF